MSAIVQFSGITFGIRMKIDLFQSCGHCWVFQICWHIEWNMLTASSFRIWNSSTGIPSPPLALFVVMLPKAHLTSHSRIPGSRWVIIPSWLSGSWRPFLYSSSVYSCHLWSRAKANRILSRKPTGHSKYPPPTTQEITQTWTSPDGQYLNQIDCILYSQR